MAATFYSHAFSVAQENAQLAVVDAYDGSAPGALMIAQGTKRRGESAQLKPGTAVTLAPGAYQVSLDDSSSKSVKTVALTATDGGSHGVPQELVVFSGESSERSGASRASAAFLAA